MEKLNDIVQKKSRELEDSLKNANIENQSLKAKSTQDVANAMAEMYLYNNKYILVIHNAYWNVQYALNKFTVNANDKSTM